MHVVIVGGTAEIAQPLIYHYLFAKHDKVTVVCRDPERMRLTYNGRLTCIQTVLEAEPFRVMITCMGSVANAKMENLGSDDWDRVLDSCLTSVAHAIKWCPDRMEPNGGNVVVIGSVVGSSGGYGCANYAAAKAGLVGLVRAAANEWASRSVCISLLELGFTELGMGARLEPKVKERALASIPLRRFGTAEDVVLAVDFLSRTRYMSGNVLTLAGGLR